MVRKAQIFISYAWQNRELAAKVEQGLLAEGHQSVWPVNELLAGKGWGVLMPDRIQKAYAVVALISENSRNSPYSFSELGAARVLSSSSRRTALVPVLVDSISPPPEVQDILQLKASRDATNLGDLIGEINRAISAHLEALSAESLRIASPKIFVSHRHKDQDIARALVELIDSSVVLTQASVRCTSVQPYRLPFGRNTGERLRDEIARSEVVLGILSKDTSESSYVMFELGAAWSQKIYTCPLLSKGADYSHIPGPIFDLSPARLWVEADCHQLLEDLEKECTLEKRAEGRGRISERVMNLAKIASA